MLRTTQPQLASNPAIPLDARLAEPAVATRHGAVPAAQWLPAIAASLLYPMAVQLFVEGYHAALGAGGTTRALYGLGALAMLTLAIAAPGLALRSLYTMRLNASPRAYGVRRLLHLACTVPPLYLVWIRVAGLGSLRGSTAALVGWGIGWVVLATLAWSASRGAVESASAPVPASSPVEPADAAKPSLLAVLTGRSRKVHRVAVVALLGAFLVAHLANHLFALWSVSAQTTVMDALRLWYRAIWMEPLILALFVLAAFTGLLRLSRLTRAPADGWRVLQTASGGYIAIFLVSHIWATLGARYHGIDTNWAFASGGKAGMLASGVAAMVLLYYTFALLAVAVHAGLGLRMVLLSRRVRAAAANRSARWVFACGSAMSALIVAALLGARLAGG
ncbi:MAG: hypothetical protein ACREU3_16645 [Steroidobacteraceae bacterium]